MTTSNFDWDLYNAGWNDAMEGRTDPQQPGNPAYMEGFYAGVWDYEGLQQQDAFDEEEEDVYIDDTPF